MPSARRFTHAPVWAVAFITLAATVAAWLQAMDVERERRLAALQSRVDHLESEVRRRLSTLHGLLSGAQGLFAASKAVERDEWYHFVNRMQLPENWPDVYNFAYVAWVPRADREAWLAATRADGAPDFQVRPQGDTDAWIVVTFAEPRSRNAAVVGYDLSTKPPSAEAVLRARDTGEVAMSQGIRLEQEPARQMAVMLSLPVYRNDAPQGTLEQRRDAFQGCVGVAVRLGDFMTTILDEEEPGWKLRLYDGPNATKDCEIFAQEASAASGEAMLEGTTAIEFAGQRWTLDVGIPAGKLQEGTPRVASLILLIGLGFSALMTVLVWSLVTRRSRAVALAARMTADLHLSAERVRGILDSARDAIVTMNEEGNVESMNAAASRVFGYPPSEVLGRPLTMLMPERWRDHHLLGLKRYLGGGAPKVIGRTLEVEGQRKDGSIVAMEIAVSELRLGERRMFTGIIRDVTERRAHEEQMRSANRKLAEAMTKLETTQREVVQQERLRAIGTMASGIAHDFNNSLASILGFTELLLVSEGLRTDPEALRTHLELIRTAATDASGVVSRLREFYRHRDEAEVLSPVNLGRIVEDAVGLTRPRWKDMAQARGVAIDVRVDLAPDLPEIQGNETELREVAINLIMNAVDAMPKGGTLTISTRSDGRRVVAEFEDTGTGMTEEVRKRCMEPFFTTKGAQGSGLGLAVAYGVVQRHGATLDIESAPGEGTRIRIAIPFRTGMTPLPAPATRAVVPASLHVLVVEDDPLVQQVVAGYLSAAGHTVETACNGREGLEKFHAGRFDLVVTDQGMPELTGTQLAAAIKSAAPTKPVLLLTGWGEQMQAAGEQPAGVDRIINKPVSLSALLDAVGELVARAR
ncbi:MAG: CHASE domain-containing protein [Planctomycetota bacterium]